MGGGSAPTPPKAAPAPIIPAPLPIPAIPKAPPIAMTPPTSDEQAKIDLRQQQANRYGLKQTLLAGETGGANSNGKRTLLG